MGLVNSAWDPLTVHNHVKIDLSKKNKNKAKTPNAGTKNDTKCVQNAKRYPGVWMNFK